MTYLSIADWVVIAIYLVGVSALGIWFGRDQHNTRDYFLGGKSTSWWRTTSSSRRRIFSG